MPTSIVLTSGTSVLIFWVGSMGACKTAAILVFTVHHMGRRLPISHVNA